MATIKKISGLSDAGTLTTTHRLLVEDSSGNLKSTTVGAVNTHTHTWSEVTGKPSTFTPASHTQGEATLTWGGKNFSGTYGPVDASMIPELGANRLAFGKPAGITIEYSRDGGSTWNDYGADANSKANLFSPPGSSFAIGKADSANKATADYLLRIIINTSSFNVYTALNKFMIYCTTNGSTGSYCSIDAALESTPTTFVNFANKVPISGWSGYNIINTSSITTYGNASSTQYGRLRFTFGCTGGSTSYSGLTILKIYGFGGVGWNAPSNLARTGHIYSIGTGQSVVFPGSVTANGGFSGSLTGTATTATKLGTTTVGGTTTPIYLNAGTPTALNYTISKSVPANAVFTDTKVTQTAVDPSGYTNYRPLVFGSSNGDTAGFAPTTITDVVYTCKDLYVRPSEGLIHGSAVENAVWNDLSDSIPVDDDCELEHGYCYCFNGEKYTKSSRYLDEGIIGIHSDTYGFRMGAEEGRKKIDVAVAGFVLAYVDKEYKPGTPLTCTENGYLTEIRREDKIEYPERIVATYWKNEPAGEWGSDSRKVKVNGRKWVKVV